MMLVMRIIRLLKTLNRCIRLAESLCSLCIIQPYVFQILEVYAYDINNFRGRGSFPGWFQVMFPGLFQIVPGWFQVILAGFRSFQVVLVLVSAYTRPYKKL